jgi:hypothetical protein
MADDTTKPPETPAANTPPEEPDDTEATWTRLGDMLGSALSPIADRLAKLEAHATAKPKDDKQHGKGTDDDSGTKRTKRDDAGQHEHPRRRRLLDIL